MQDDERRELMAAIESTLRQGKSKADVVQQLMSHGYDAGAVEALIEEVDARIRASGSSTDSPQPPPLDLGELFPDMRPIQSPPSLFTLNGIGLTAYGKRDHEPQTGSHVITHFFAVLFIPIFALGAYRVIRAREGGWYFLGKVPISGAAKAWNVCTICAIVAVIAGVVISAQLSSDEAVAGRKIESARQAEEAGKLSAAAAEYADVATGNTSHVGAAQQGLKRILDSPGFLDLEVDAARMVVAACSRAVRSSPQSLPNLGDRTLQYLDQNSPQAVKSLALLEAVAPAHPDLAHQRLVSLLQEQSSVEQFSLLLPAAIRMAETEQMRASVRTVGTELAQRIRGDDLLAALQFTELLAPLGDPSDTDQAVLDLLDDQILDLDADDFAEVIRVAQGVISEPVASAAISQKIDQWLDVHPETTPQQGLGILAHSRELAPTRSGAINVSRLALANIDQDLLAKLRAKKRAFLDEALAADPDNLDLTIQFVELLEMLGESQRIIEVLEPMKDRLQSTEATRILGQAYAAARRYGEARETLRPYVDARLDALHEAEAAFQSRVERVQEDLLEWLRNGTATEFDYAGYDLASDQQKQVMVADFVNTHIADDDSVANARMELQQKAAVVPVVLDLGMATLQLAQQEQDPDARQRQLEEAEETFLAISNLAGDTDEYQLSLGQVYYWLGKTKEGRAQFDQLLEKWERAPETLLAVAGVLHSLGEWKESHQLAEESHEKAGDEQLKYRAAYIAALTSPEQEERLAWLKKSNPALPNVAAELAKYDGDEAFRAGDVETAEKLYRQGIADYDKLPKSAMSLNNAALIYEKLYELNGNPRDLAEAVDRTQAALELAPSDGILAGNLGSLQIRLACQELLGPEVDLHQVSAIGDLGALNVLVNNAEEAEQLRRRLTENPTLQEALANLDRAITTAPKNVGLYMWVFSIHSAAEDAQALKVLYDRASAAELDLTRINEYTAKAYLGPKDDSERAERQQDRDRAWAVVEQYRPTDNHPSLTLAVRSWVHHSLATAEKMTDIDAEKMLTIAEEAHERQPSFVSVSNMNVALYVRALQQVSNRFPEVAESWEKVRYAMREGQLVALLINRPGEVADALQANEDIQRVMDNLELRISQFPTYLTYRDWANLRATRPAAAEAVLKMLEANETRKWRLTLTELLAESSVDANLMRYWALLSQGDRAGAEQVLQALRQRDAPLP